MIKNLYDVMFLETTYPCWAYALARTGKSNLLTLDWIKNVDRILQVYDPKKDALSIGDILVWKSDKNGSFYAPISVIGADIIWNKIAYAHHVGVYEGLGLVTDMVKTDVNFDLPFIIRKRRLEDLSNPDYFIRL